MIEMSKGKITKPLLSAGLWADLFLFTLQLDKLDEAS